jgi:nucleoside diphosphate kinase
LCPWYISLLTEFLAIYLLNMLSGFMFAWQAWEGVGVVASACKLIGATYPLQAEPGTIRGDIAVQKGR